MDEITDSSERIKLYEKIKRDLDPNYRSNSPYKNKTDDELIEMFYTENKVTKMKDVELQSTELIENPLIIEKINLIADATTMLPEGAIKKNIFWLIDTLNMAILQQDAVKAEARAWRSRADAFLTEYIKETFVKQAKRESGGNYGRAF